MSSYYNPKRASNWNYGGANWKLSRSKIDLFLECPRCFYLDNKLGLKRVPSLPFTLNSAVDHLLKQEFDIYRAKSEQHPLQKSYGLKVRPVAREELEEWRRNFGGITYLEPKTQLLVSGAIDDLWIDEAGNYIVVDYKSTAREEPVTSLDAQWQDSYKRQLEVYQWLLRKNGLAVSDTAYFVYCTGKLDRQAFDKKIEFDVNLIAHQGSDAWLEPVLVEIKNCLESDTIPASSLACDHCNYFQARQELKE